MFFKGNNIPSDPAERYKVVAVDSDELIGVYECQGCMGTYESEKGSPEIPPVCTKCADSHDMLLLGYCVR